MAARMIVLLLAAVICTSSAETWDREAFLDTDNKTFHVKWVVGDEQITFEVTARTTGYVALGFNHDGGMRGADVIVGWVKDGVATVQDRFAEDYEEPVMDEQQDVHLLSGSENATHTTLRFRRKLSTCDKKDVEINKDTLRLLYATHTDDPSPSGKMRKHSYKGVYSTLLLDEMVFEMPKDDNIKVWETKTPALTIPVENRHTVYWSSIHKAPELDTKHHIVAWQVIIGNKKIEPHAHHIIIYSCNVPHGTKEFDDLIGKGFETFDRHSPEPSHHCVAPLIVWAVGIRGQVFDETSGYPIGDGNVHTKYFMLEIHYTDLGQFKGTEEEKHDVGLQVILSPKLKKQDGWTFIFGHEFTEQIIPPLQPAFVSVGHCTSKCTKETLSKTGIQIRSIQLHTHLTGKKIKVRHFREGIELPTIADDEFYDPNMQAFRKLEEPVTVLPGDQITIECTYDTSKRKNITWGGLSVYEEMCAAIIDYYPKQNISICSSHPYLPDLAKFFGFTPPTEVRALNEPTPYANFVENFDFKSNLKKYQEFLLKGRSSVVCVKFSRTEPQSEEPVDVPVIKSLYVKKEVKCGNKTITK